MVGAGVNVRTWQANEYCKKFRFEERGWLPLLMLQRAAYSRHCVELMLGTLYGIFPPQKSAYSIVTKRVITNKRSSDPT